MHIPAMEPRNELREVLKPTEFEVAQGKPCGKSKSSACSGRSTAYREGFLQCDVLAAAAERPESSLTKRPGLSSLF